MKKYLKITLVTIFVFQSISSYSEDYICYYMMNVEIKNTMDEHQKQIQMRNRQLGNLSTETYNKGEWNKFQTVTTKIKSRLNAVSLAIQAIPTSATIVREINNIYSIQESIYNELADAPMWIPIALSGQYEFIDMLQMNIRLMAGIIISYGTINQMEKAERQTLLDFASGEIKTLRLQSTQTLQQIRIAKRKLKQRQNMFDNWLNKDKKIINDIIDNAQNI
jgi:hypothetical protein